MPVPISSSSSIKLRIFWFKLSNQCPLSEREPSKLISRILSFSWKSAKIVLIEFISLVTALVWPRLVLVRLSILAIVINSCGQSKRWYPKEEKQRYLKESNPDKTANRKSQHLDSFYTNSYTVYLIRILFQLCLVTRCKQTHQLELYIIFCV